MAYARIHTSQQRHNLPAQLTSFVGRERDIAEIIRLLSTARLVTLTGAGGVGKTRLAAHVAAELVDRYPHGVWLVELAPLAEPSLIPQVIASTLRLREESERALIETLIDYLRARALLLILDSCEHVVGPCAELVSKLLRACPQLLILATSRAALGIVGETAWHVRSLALPDRDQRLPAEQLLQYEGVRLFLDRAASALPSFTLTDENARAVVQICRRLDGIPLAIELAAAWVAVLSPEQIAARLQDRFWVLTGGRARPARQQTLRSTLDWSYELLSDRERLFFNRLAVFVSGFTLEAAETVCASAAWQPDVLDLLSQLVGKSLVVAEAGGDEARYRLLEPVRQYASERLVMSGDLEALRQRHARYYLAVAEAAEPELLSGRRVPWLARLETELDNIRAGLAWSRQAAERGDAVAAELGVRLAGALAWFWTFRPSFREGRRWAEGALAAGRDGPLDARAKALFAAGMLAWRLGDQTVACERLGESAALWRRLGDKAGLARTLLHLGLAAGPHPEQPGDFSPIEEGIALFREIGDRWGLALAIHALGIQTFYQGDAAAGRRWLEESLELLRVLGDAWFIAQTLNFLGDIARSLGEYARAAALYEESVTLLRAEGLQVGVPSLLHNLGYVALRQGEAARARQLFQEGLVLFRDQVDQRGMAECLAGLAGALGALGQPVQAARLFGAVEALFEATELRIWPTNRADYERSLAAVHAQVAEAAFKAAWAEGRVMSLEQAIVSGLASEEATSRDRTGPAGARTRGRFDALTPREREVAVLLAERLTNREIAERLVISAQTAETHVKRILSKLGLASRTQVAEWAREHGLLPAEMR